MAGENHVACCAQFHLSGPHLPLSVSRPNFSFTVPCLLLPLRGEWRTLQVLIDQNIHLQGSQKKIRLQDCEKPQAATRMYGVRWRSCCHHISYRLWKVCMQDPIP